MKNNKIASEEAAKLGEVLALNNTLQELDIQDCRIAEGADKLFEGLQNNKSLLILSTSISRYGRQLYWKIPRRSQSRKSIKD